MASNAQMLANLKAPSSYQSTYQAQMDALLNKILNREPFSYNPNADQLYNQYKEQYVSKGKKAMMDTQAQAANLTGGYGNSYATSAGSQAYQGYLSQLNDQIPALYQAAMEKYNTDGDNMRNNLSVLNDAESNKYNKYRDQVGDYQADRNYYQGAAQDDVSNNQWQQNFNYQAGRDQVEDNHWQQEFNLSKKASSSGGGGGRSGRSSGGRGRKSGKKGYSSNSGSSSKGTTTGYSIAPLSMKYVNSKVNSLQGKSGTAQKASLQKLVNSNRLTKLQSNAIKARADVKTFKKSTGVKGKKKKKK